MQFKSIEDRERAMMQACENYGKQLAQLKFAEWKMKEVSQSYVPEMGHAVAEPAPVPEEPKAEEAKEEVSQPKPTRKKRKPKAKPKADVEETTAVVEQSPESSSSPATEQQQDDAVAAPNTETTTDSIPVATEDDASGSDEGAAIPVNTDGGVDSDSAGAGSSGRIHGSVRSSSSGEEDSVRESPDGQSEVCPIENSQQLREFMTKKFNELGGTPDVRVLLKSTLTEATGAAKADDVPADQLAAAYTALSALTNE